MLAVSFASRGISIKSRNSKIRQVTNRRYAKKKTKPISSTPRPKFVPESRDVPDSPQVYAKLGEQVRVLPSNDPVRPLTRTEGMHLQNTKARIQTSKHDAIKLSQLFATEEYTPEKLEATVSSLTQVLTSLVYLEKFQEAEDVVNSILAIDPKNFTAIQTKAMILLRMGKIEEALSHFDGILLADPRNVQALVAKAILYTSAGRTTESLKLLTRASGIAPKSPDVWNAIGGALKAENKMEEAIDAFKRSLVFQPKDISALSELTHLYMSVFDYESALKYAEMAHEASPTYPFALADKGTIFVRTGKIADGLRFLDLAAEMSPDDNSRILFDKAALLLSLDRNEEAKALFSRIDLPEVPIYTAIIYLRESDFDSARRELRKIDQGNEHYATAQQWTRVIEAGEQALKMATPTDKSVKPVRIIYEVLVQNINTLIDDPNNHDPVTTMLNIMTTLFSREVDILTRASEIHHRLKNRNEALDLLDRALALSPKTIGLYVKKGSLLMESLLQVPAALKVFHDALAIDVTNKVVLQKRAHCCVLHNPPKLNDAVETYQNILKIHSDDLQSWNNLVYIEALRGNFTKALERVDAALEKFPNSITLLQNKVLILKKLEDTQQVDSILTTILSLEPFNDFALHEKTSGVLPSDLQSIKPSKYTRFVFIK